MKTDQTTDVDDLLTAEDVAALFEVSVRTIWNWQRASLLPEPVRVSRRYVRWRLSDLQSMLDGRSEAD